MKEHFAEISNDKQYSILDICPKFASDIFRATIILNNLEGTLAYICKITRL